MKKSIIYSSILLFFAGIFFVTNDAIINYLSQTDIKFYHFIFYGIPIFLCFPIYLYFNCTLKKNLKCSNYFPPINVPAPRKVHIVLVPSSSTKIVQHPVEISGDVNPNGNFSPSRIISF